MIKILIAALLYGIFFGGVEVAGNRFRIPKETSRKTVHVIAGTTAAFLPFVMSFRQVALLSLIFVVVMLASKRINLFSAIHGVKRATYGEVFFPCAILLSAVFFPHKALYVYGLLVMALSDGFASIVGQKFGKRSYRIWASRKTYAGSATFLLLAVLIGLGVQLVADVGLGPAAAVSLTLALILTMTEAAMPYGLDNLVLPPLAAFLLSVASSL